MKNAKELLAENKQWIDTTFEAIDNKLSKVTLRSRDKLATGADANLVHAKGNPRHWVSGFWGGLNCMMYAYTKKEDYLITAKRQVELLDPAFMMYETLSHDVGFMWHLAAGAYHRLTGDEGAKVRNLYMASYLYSRFVPSGGFIRSWDGPWRDIECEGVTIIDNMMNLPQLYWASDVIGDDRFKQIAMAHADATLCDHVREDGSVAHIVQHDRETGEVIKTYGGQGYCEGSSWSRGQSWALYGFVISYLHTGEQRYLDCAKRVAHYFIANCCDDWLPRVDFRAPSEPVYYDSSAGACAACGLIEIAKAVGEHEGGMYMNAALNILKAMGEKFLNLDENNDVLLTHGSSIYPLAEDQIATKVHIYLNYGDFFYTEALLKLKGTDFLIW